jgi:hypothetical protein
MQAKKNCKCSATCTITNEDVIKNYNGNHNHDDLDKIQIEVNKFRSTVRSCVLTEDTKASFIITAN